MDMKLTNKQAGLLVNLGTGYMTMMQLTLLRGQVGHELMLRARLKRLEKRGLVSSRFVSPEFIYPELARAWRITDLGIDVLCGWRSNKGLRRKGG